MTHDKLDHSPREFRHDIFSKVGLFIIMLLLIAIFTIVVYERILPVVFGIFTQF